MYLVKRLLAPILIAVVAFMAINKSLDFYYFGDAFTMAYNGVHQICPFLWPFKTICPVLNSLYSFFGDEPRIFFTLSFLSRIVLGFTFYLFSKKYFNQTIALLLALGLVSMGGEDVVLGYYALLANVAISLSLLSLMFLSFPKDKRVFYHLVAVGVYFFSLEYFTVFSTGHILLIFPFLLLLLDFKIKQKNKLLLIVIFCLLTFRTYLYLPYTESGEILTFTKSVPSTEITFSYLFLKFKHLLASVSFFLIPERLQDYTPEVLSFLYTERLRYLVGLTLMLTGAIYAFVNRNNKRILLLSLFSLVWIIGQFIPKAMVTPSWIGREDRHFYYFYPGFLFLLGAFSFKHREITKWLLIVIVITNVFLTSRYLDTLTQISINKHNFFEGLKKYSPTLSKGSVIFLDGPRGPGGIGELTRVGHYPSKASIGYALKANIDDFELLTDSETLIDYWKRGSIVRDKFFSYYYQKNNLIDTTENLKKELFSEDSENEVVEDISKHYETEIFQDANSGTWVGKNTEPEFKLQKFNSNIPSTVYLTLKASMFEFPLPYSHGGVGNYIPDINYYYDLLTDSKKIRQKISKLSGDFKFKHEISAAFDADDSTYWEYDRASWYDGNYPKIDVEFNNPVTLRGFAFFQNSPHKPTGFDIAINGKPTEYVYAKGMDGLAKIFFPSQRVKTLTLTVTETQSDAPRIQEIILLDPKYVQLDLDKLGYVMNSPYKYINNSRERDSLANYMKEGISACVIWESQSHGRDQKKFQLIPDGISREYAIKLPTLGLKNPVFKLGCLAYPVEVDIYKARIKKFW